MNCFEASAFHFAEPNLRNQLRWCRRINLEQLAAAIRHVARFPLTLRSSFWSKWPPSPCALSRGLAGDMMILLVWSGVA